MLHRVDTKVSTRDALTNTTTTSSVAARRRSHDRPEQRTNSMVTRVVCSRNCFAAQI